MRTWRLVLVYVLARSVRECLAVLLCLGVRRVPDSVVTLLRAVLRTAKAELRR